MEGFNKLSIGGPLYNGVEITKEEYERIFSEYKRELDELYNSRVDKIINKIKERTISKEKRIVLLYNIFINLFEIDDSYLSGIMPSGSAETIYYKFKDYDIKYASSTNKYGPLIFGKGVCKGFSEAFKDICDKMQIKCDLVVGETFMGHQWNAVFINNALKMVDCFYGIMERRRGGDPQKYLLVSSEQLKSYKTHFNFEESLMKSTKSFFSSEFKTKGISFNENELELLTSNEKCSR